MALAEAVVHLNKGMESISELPSSAERGGHELDLRVLLGTAWLALRGWPAQEVRDTLQPALELAPSLDRNDALPMILWGLWANVANTGRLTASLRWVTQMLGTGETFHGTDAARTERAPAVSRFPSFARAAPIVASISAPSFEGLTLSRALGGMSSVAFPGMTAHLIERQTVLTKMIGRRQAETFAPKARRDAPVADPVPALTQRQLCACYSSLDDPPGCER